MQTEIRLFPSLGILAFILFQGLEATAATPLRSVLSLDGEWQVAEGKLAQLPLAFEHKIPVPGLADMALPPFKNVGLGNKGKAKDSPREAFWYRRTFTVDGPLPAMALLKVHKAAYGTRVYLNGRLVGEHLPCFTPGYFDLTKHLKANNATNELVIRIGATHLALPRYMPYGHDNEKKCNLPGIYDSIELILAGTPYIVNVQAAPDLAAKSVRVQAVVRAVGADAKAAPSVTIREAKSGKVAGRASFAPEFLAAGSERTMEVYVPLAESHLWSPDDPFLYELTVDSGADQFCTRFGLRDFRFDPTTGQAVLNGKPYFMRGSNICIFRFMDDADRQNLPWQQDWVRQMHRCFKDMHWNSLRYCIGFPPECWYRIADEEGLLIQDEFPIWGPSNLASTNELVAEYTEWMQERWNHPCVVIWDAQNETQTNQNGRLTGLAIQQVRSLDLSHRPWDNGWGLPVDPGDSYESHPYHFINANFKLKDIGQLSGSPTEKWPGNIGRSGSNAVIINEYGWLWLTRDGMPTLLTRNLYKNLLGSNSTTAERRQLYARYTAAETEFWRSHRKAAAVLEFCALGYSRPDGQTSDHWLDVAKLQWEPEFYRYVRDAFAPVGVMIDAWAEEYPGGKPQGFPVAIINDLYSDWSGTICFRLLSGAKVIREEKQLASVPTLGRIITTFRMDVPMAAGTYQAEAILLNTPAGDVHSLRDFHVSQQ